LLQQLRNVTAGTSPPSKYIRADLINNGIKSAVNWGVEEKDSPGGARIDKFNFHSGCGSSGLNIETYMLDD
jgi:hypothetical protein